MHYLEKANCEMYQNLGKLFYAVAAADGNVHQKEVDKLRSFISKFWLGVDEVEDAFGTDAAYQIEIVFDWLVENESDTSTNFAEFEDYYRQHGQKFTTFIKILVMDTATAIANAFSGSNKAELIVLNKLRLLLR